MAGDLISRVIPARRSFDFYRKGLLRELEIALREREMTVQEAETEIESTTRAMAGIASLFGGTHG